MEMAYKTYQVEFDREEDGRWIADIPGLPGVMAYGATKEEATANVEALALRVVAEQVETSKKALSAVTFS